MACSPTLSFRDNYTLLGIEESRIRPLESLLTTPMVPTVVESFPKEDLDKEDGLARLS